MSAYARIKARPLPDLWDDEDPPSNWRPRISQVELTVLITELFVFYRASNVTVHRRENEPVHLDIEQPKGVSGWGRGGIYLRLHRQMSERSGFTYAVGPTRK
jgi:hypothetical protein